jgi:hypothetical protein
MCKVFRIAGANDLKTRVPPQHPRDPGGVAELALIFHPISKPAVNDLPLVVVARTEIEKVCPFIL